MSPQNETAVFLDEAKRRAILQGGGRGLLRRPGRQGGGFRHQPAVVCAAAVDPRSCSPTRGCSAACATSPGSWTASSGWSGATPSSLRRFSRRPDERATVYSRTEALAHRDRVVGFAYSALKEAYYGEHSDHLLLIDYDILTASRKPACGWSTGSSARRGSSTTSARRVRRAGVRPSLGAPGLHRVSGPVRHEVRPTVLPPDLFERFDQLTFWNDPRGTAAWRISPEAPTTRTTESGKPEGSPSRRPH